VLNGKGLIRMSLAMDGQSQAHRDVLVAVLRRPFSFGTTPKDEDHDKRNKNGSPKAPVSNPNQ
jgi:hypothetical protein